MSNTLKINIETADNFSEIHISGIELVTGHEFGLNTRDNISSYTLIRGTVFKLNGVELKNSVEKKAVINCYKQG